MIAAGAVVLVLVLLVVAAASYVKYRRNHYYATNEGEHSDSIYDPESVNASVLSEVDVIAAESISLKKYQAELPRIV